MKDSKRIIKDGFTNLHKRKIKYKASNGIINTGFIISGGKDVALVRNNYGCTEYVIKENVIEIYEEINGVYIEVGYGVTKALKEARKLIIKGLLVKRIPDRLKDIIIYLQYKTEGRDAQRIFKKYERLKKEVETYVSNNNKFSSE